MMTLHRQLGRKYETVKRWTRQIIKKHAPKTVIKSFKELCSVKSKANVKYIAVCTKMHEGIGTSGFDLSYVSEDNLASKLFGTEIQNVSTRCAQF